MRRGLIFALPGVLFGLLAVVSAYAAPVFLVVEFEVTDPAGFNQFASASAPLIKAHGGEFLSRLNKVMPASGPAPPNATLIWFPSLENAQSYLTSYEYKALAPRRDKSSKFRSFLMQAGDLAIAP